MSNSNLYSRSRNDNNISIGSIFRQYKFNSSRTCYCKFYFSSIRHQHLSNQIKIFSIYFDNITRFSIFLIHYSFYRWQDNYQIFFRVNQIWQLFTI